MIEYIITKGEEYYPIDDNPMRMLFETAVKEYQKKYDMSDEAMRKIDIVGACCYNKEPHHQIARQLQIMTRAKYDIIVIQTSIDKDMAKYQRMTINKFFMLHDSYEELKDVYENRVVYALIPTK